MQDAEVLVKLEEIVQQLGLELRWEDGHFTGGTCHLGNKMMFIINSSLPTFQKVGVLCRERSRLTCPRFSYAPISELEGIWFCVGRMIRELRRSPHLSRP